ncbi:hypothetical protein FRC91_05475 [Bradymonadales bacterium TMQ1]|uniref:Uncharacterized protein n=1 Tax=Lujinxingia sediminis TaxID=2480984 RepID=A0ABY0CYT0_9DELT|nr:hypothetical protein [Lujinxingia sediminis]RVU48884.1 hypothetical protein EA187_05510 [Lujinxingia sediminis]TXC78178.1 hypothetical protein FRC91_05475 [Bradymonadales bacterium TMQ1]
MTESNEILEAALASAEQKLRDLEESQAKIEEDIERTQREIASLENTIKAFTLLQTQLNG